MHERSHSAWRKLFLEVSRCAMQKHRSYESSDKLTCAKSRRAFVSRPNSFIIRGMILKTNQNKTRAKTKFDN